YKVTLVILYNVIHFQIPNEVEVVILSNKTANRPFYLKAIDYVKFMIGYHHLIKSKKISISVSFLAFPNLINGLISILNKNVKTIISERGFPSDNVTSKLSLYISKVFYPLFYNRCDK